MICIVKIGGFGLSATGRSEAVLVCGNIPLRAGTLLESADELIAQTRGYLTQLRVGRCSDASRGISRNMKYSKVGLVDDAQRRVGSDPVMNVTSAFALPLCPIFPSLLLHH